MPPKYSQSSTPPGKWAGHPWRKRAPPNRWRTGSSSWAELNWMDINRLIIGDKHIYKPSVFVYTSKIFLFIAVHLYLSPSILYIYGSIYFMYLSSFPATQLSTYLSTYLAIYLYIHIYIYIRYLYTYIYISLSLSTTSIYISLPTYPV